MAEDVVVQPARPDELPAVMGVLDGALLETEFETVRARVHDEAVLVAEIEGRVLGALVCAEGENTDDTTERTELTESTEITARSSVAVSTFS